MRIHQRKQLLARPERQASILRGAAAAFAHRGFAGTSMDDVAAACGVTKLIVYRHFDSKEVLYRAVLERVFHRMGEELELALRGDTSRGVGARTILNVAREDPDGFVLLWRHAAREPQFADYAQQQRDLAAAAVRELMGLHTDDPVMDLWKSEAVFGWLVESTLLWLELGDASRDAEFIAQTTEALRAIRGAWPA